MFRREVVRPVLAGHVEAMIDGWFGCERCSGWVPDNRQGVILAVGDGGVEPFEVTL